MGVLTKDLELVSESFAPSTIQASVVICTHNPRPAYLSRVLAALRNQTFPFDRWEIVLIDNASNSDLSKTYDLSWHPKSKHVREERLGVAHARYRALNETTSDLIVFVDDDNVIDSDYLTVGTELGKKWPILGTWGGQNIAEFEIQPASYLAAYFHDLAVRPCHRDSWTNIANWSDAFPFGAGMFIRRQVMIEYHKAVAASPFRLSLGRKGTSLIGGEDYDMNLTACDMGLGCGVFRALRLTHLMPAQRLTDEYMIRLEHGTKYSNTMLACLRGNEPPDPISTWRTLIRWKLGSTRFSSPHRRLQAAGLSGVRDALRAWHNHNRSGAH